MTNKTWHVFVLVNYYKQILTEVFFSSVKWNLAAIIKIYRLPASDMFYNSQRVIILPVRLIWFILLAELLESGKVKVDCCDQQGRTALEMAVTGNDVESVTYLLERSSARHIHKVRTCPSLYIYVYIYIYKSFSFSPPLSFLLSLTHTHTTTRTHRQISSALSACIPPLLMKLQETSEEADWTTQIPRLCSSDFSQTTESYLDLLRLVVYTLRRG